MKMNREDIEKLINEKIINYHNEKVKYKLTDLNESIDETIECIYSKINIIESNLNDFTERIEYLESLCIEEKIMDLQSEINNLEREISDVRSSSNDYDIECRVDDLESQTVSLDSRIDELESKITTLELQND